MPVRSSTSSVLRWPDRTAVDTAVRRWARAVARANPAVRRIGYFGSYARGDWGVGSDVDIVVIVDDSDQPFARRALDFDATRLPVPADVLVYTPAEWARLTAEAGFARRVEAEAVWVFTRGSSPSAPSRARPRPGSAPEAL